MSNGNDEDRIVGLANSGVGGYIGCGGVILALCLGVGGCEYLRRSANNAPKIQSGFLYENTGTGPYKSVNVNGQPAVIEYQGRPILDHLRSENGWVERTNAE